MPEGVAPGDAVTVTAYRDKCLDLLPVTGSGSAATWATPTLLQKTEYNLCLAEGWLASHAKEWWGDAWGEIRSALDWLWGRTQSLWTGLKNVAGTVWTGVKHFAAGVGTAIHNAAKVLHDDAAAALAWVKAKAGVAGEWLLIGGLVLAAIWFLPEILDGGEVVGYAYGRKAARSYGRYRLRKARRAAA